MKLYHIVCAFIIPFIACIFSFCRKPSRTSLRVKGTCEEDSSISNSDSSFDESAFSEEFPGYFLNNSLWGMTFTIVMDKTVDWLVYYLVMLLLSFAVLIIHFNKQFSIKLKKFIYNILFYISIIALIFRIFGVPIWISNVIQFHIFK